MEKIEMKELENVMNRLEKETKKKEQAENKIKQLRQKRNRLKRNSDTKRKVEKGGVFEKFEKQITGAEENTDNDLMYAPRLGDGLRARNADAGEQHITANLRSIGQFDRSERRHSKHRKPDKSFGDERRHRSGARRQSGKGLRRRRFGNQKARGKLECAR